MKKTFKKTIKKVIAIVLLAAIVFAGAALPSQTALASDTKTVTVTYSLMDYNSGIMGSYTVTIDSEELQAYCLEADVTSPTYTSVTATVTVYECTDDYVRAALYFGYGGPGEISGITEYATHQIASYFFSGQITQSGLYTDKMQSSGASGLYEYVLENYASVPECFSVYYCYPSGTACQAIGWWEYTYGLLDIKKVSSNTDITSSNENYSLKGAKYTVYTDRSCSSKALDTDGNAAVFTLDASGGADAIKLYTGTYYVRETTAPPGYEEDTGVYTVIIKSDETTWVNSGSVSDSPLYAQPDLILLKKSDEEDTSFSLSGAVYKVCFYTSTSSSGSPARTWYLETDSDGYIKLSQEYLAQGYDSDEFYYSGEDAVLPLGSISLQEIKAPDGYLLDETVYTAQITETSGSAQITWTTEGFLSEADGCAVHTESYVRAGLELYKLDADGEAMAYIPFLITRVYTNEDGEEVSESRIFVTDEEGYFNSEEREKSADNVNVLDPEIYVSGDAFTGTDEELIEAASYNIWFGSTDDIEEGKGSLLCGEYTVTELRCSSNEGNTLLSKTFTISEADEDGNTKTTESETEIMTVIMVDLDVDIDTNAFNAITGTKNIFASQEALASDEISIDNLSSKAIYKLYVDFADEEGNSAGSVWSDEFSPEKTGSVIKITLDAYLDTSAYTSGGTITALVYLYQEIDGQFYEVASHADMDDEDEQLYLPWLSTTAKDSETQTNTGTQTSSCQVIDTVTYANLDEGENYRLIAALADTDGNVYATSSMDIHIYSDTAVNRKLGYTLSSDTVQMAGLELDSSSLSDITLYVNEAIYLIGTDDDGQETLTLVVYHDSASLLIEEQAIYYPEIPEETTQEITEETTKETQTTTSAPEGPETGDGFNSILWGIIVLLAALLLLGVLLKGRADKKKKEEKKDG